MKEQQMILRRDKIRRFFSHIFSLSIPAALFRFLVGCTRAPIRGAESESQRLVDGVCDGSYRRGPHSATVRMTIPEGKVVDIEVIKHFASWKGNKANDIVLQSLAAEQSTEVEAVSGATNSSRGIMSAVQEAPEKAYREKV